MMKPLNNKFVNISAVPISTKLTSSNFIIRRDNQSGNTEIEHMSSKLKRKTKPIRGKFIMPQQQPNFRKIDFLLAS